jgi:hypothetical protein
MSRRRPAAPTSIDESVIERVQAGLEAVKRPSRNRISGFEFIAYTLGVVLLAAIALGYFDVMLPWSQ